MSEAKVNIDKLTIALHGVSASIAEEAIGGLDQELRRRFNEFQLRDLAINDLSNLSLTSVEVKDTLDPGALRALIADRLFGAITQGKAEKQEGTESAGDAQTEGEE